MGGVEAPPEIRFLTFLVVFAENAASRLINLKKVGDLVQRQPVISTVLKRYKSIRWFVSKNNCNLMKDFLRSLRLMNMDKILTISTKK